VLGSIDILGNPVGLFSNIGTGVSDLFEKPIEGFARGPLEGGLGVIKGTGSLITNTFTGVFNSVNKITGSVGSGIAALSLVIFFIYFFILNFNLFFYYYLYLFFYYYFYFKF
jgi:vacuolar protein sorting-associated protein 13A/C